MLNLYVGNSNLPKSTNLVKDVDAFFAMSTLDEDDFTKLVLKHIEQAEIINSVTFKDRFGGGLYTDCLSTGVKILLSAYRYPQYVFSCSELGLNAWPFVSLLTDSSLYFENEEFELQPCIVAGKDGSEHLDVTVNGRICHTYEEVNAIIGGYDV